MTATSTNRRSGEKVPATYAGKLARFSDHVGAVNGFGELSCGAGFSGAVGDCTRARGHVDGTHQNGATLESWREDNHPMTAAVDAATSQPEPGTLAYAQMVAEQHGDLEDAATEDGYDGPAPDEPCLCGSGFTCLAGHDAAPSQPEGERVTPRPVHHGVTYLPPDPARATRRRVHMSRGDAWAMVTFVAVLALWGLVLGAAWVGWIS